MLSPADHRTAAGGGAPTPRNMSLHLAPLLFLTQSSDGILPEDGGARVVFVVVGVAILGLYFLIRRTRARAVSQYNERRRREQAQRDADPDLRRDDA